MSRYNNRRVQYDAAAKTGNEEEEREPSDLKTKVKLEPFMGVKARRLASIHRDYSGDYLNVSSQPLLLKILNKQGDSHVLFADKVLKFTGTGKMKRRILIITDFALYIVDPESFSLKRRIALAAVEKLYLSTFSDNFFAIVIPTEYDMLMASTRKSEIVTVLVEATKNTSNFELDVLFKNSHVLFADKVLKFTGTGKMKRRILIITDFALYIVDPESFSLKRRIALAAVEKLYLSTFSDNFFAIVIPTEYDMLMASTRKSEIVTVLVEATKNTSNFELDVLFKNRFEYNPAADLVKEVHFEEVEGGVKTRILLKPDDDE